MPEKQDLGISQPGKPDRLWQRRRPEPMALPAAMLDRPSQRVTLRNTSDRTADPKDPLDRGQVHVIRDRYGIAHELQPGEAKELDMAIDEIQYFIKESDPSRKFSDGEPKPLHPVKVEGVNAETIAREWEMHKTETERKQQEKLKATMRQNFSEFIAEMTAKQPVEAETRRNK
jgi:hypothetical protein